LENATNWNTIGTIFAVNKITKLITMRNVLSFFSVLLILFSACEKADKKIPNCINELIKNKASDIGLCETGASVKQYSFQGKDVYAFTPGNCISDGFTDVYDDNCQIIGSLGGIVGVRKINNVIFFDVAIFRKTIWSN